MTPKGGVSQSCGQGGEVRSLREELTLRGGDLRQLVRKSTLTAVDLWRGARRRCTVLESLRGCIDVAVIEVSGG